MTISKPIKLHKPLLEIVKNGLHEIFKNGSYADKEVQKILTNNKQFGSRDRSFIAETIYDIVRWKRNYEVLIESRVKSQESRQENWNYLILVSLLNRKKEIINPEIFDIEFDFNNKEKWLIDFNGRTSFPEWLDKLCSDEIGADWPAIAEALNVPAKTFIRVNTLKTTTENLLELLAKENVESKKVDEDCFVPRNDASVYNAFHETAKNCIEILSRNNLRNSSLYKAGFFEFQDFGSQLIGEFCAIQPNKTVLDLCAGAGGKTLHLSSILQNKGKIYATDFKSERTKQLAMRASHAGCKNIEIIPFSSVNSLRNLDVVLIDAPCSGLGTIKRNPDVKWKLQNETIDRYIEIQASLLEKNKSLIDKTGKIIYATCSILPSENELQVQRFLKKHPNFELRKEIKLSPHLYGVDGFYMAELVKQS